MGEQFTRQCCNMAYSLATPPFAIVGKKIESRVTMSSRTLTLEHNEVV